MKNINEVHEELQLAFDNLKNGSLHVQVASELHNNVGKQIGLIKLQLENSALRKEKPEIKFLETNNKK